MEFKSKNPDVKVSGGAILAFLDALNNRELGLKYLEKHGILNIEAKKFYSQQAFLLTQKDLAETMGVAIALEATGANIPLELPPEKAKTVFEIFENWQKHYMDNNIGDTESYFRIIERGENYLLLETNNPYPCDFDRGLIKAFAHFVQPEAKVVKWGSKCRSHGDDACTYHISWKEELSMD
ncbi:MAG: hypothetical protein JW737_03405 [Acidobacteria bacterium]|nr:hypothetical protein [Acidobacteriota bacterium]